MDNVDTEVTHEERTYCFVYTAGIRRKGTSPLVAVKFSVVMARRGLARRDDTLRVVS